MTNESIPNRWTVAAAAILMQICLGAVYAWSVFVKPLTSSQHWSLPQVALTFTIALACVGAGTVVGGLWQDRKGPRTVATVAGVLYGLGYVISSWGVEQHSLLGLYLGYGVVGGFGMGMGYICPVATMTKWFPDKRGLMTGVAVMGFGAGAVVMGLIGAREIIAKGLPFTFMSFGVAYVIGVVATAQFMVNPPKGWRPAGWEPRTAVAKSASTTDLTVAEAMVSWRFWLLWVMLFLNVSAGIMIISQASPMAQQIGGMTALEAANVVFTISIFNAVGRVFWAWISDMIGRARVYFLLYAIQAAVFFTIPRLHDATLFTVAVALIGLCYGGGFGTMPSFTADFFGSKYMGGIYGWILVAWGAGGIFSPMLIARVRQSTGEYGDALQVIAVVMVLSLILPLLARRRQPAEAARTPQARA